MTDYMMVRLDCTPCTEDITDLLADSLAEVGFESFVPDENGLSAYVNADSYDPEGTVKAIAGFPMPTAIKMSCERIEGRDWNEEWEKNYFQPIVIGDLCSVRSSFHEPVGTEIEIVIDPRMAFGTGHHSTTSQMMTYLLEMDLTGKHVIDMGTGTGILSILATKRGAKATGIEIDPDAADNARDNCRLNGSDARIITGDANALSEVEEGDLFVANINRNIILADLGRYVSRLRPGGTMLLSGFYTADIPLIEQGAAARGLRIEEIRSDKDWAAVKLLRL